MDRPADTPEPQPITREMVRAFVDGELDCADHRRVLSALMSDPQVAALVQTEQKLRQTLAGCMDCHVTMRCPDALKARLAEICESSEADTTTTTPAAASPAPAADPTPAPSPAPSPLATIGGSGWGRPALLFAAAFLVAALLVALAVLPAGPLGTGNASLATGPDAALLPDGLPTRFAKRHVMCTTGLAELANVQAMPHDPQPLSQLVADRFGAAPATLDLAPAGYRLARSGDCFLPGNNAVHAIYLASQPDRSDSLSLWVIDHNPDRALTPGRLYTPIDANHPHPMVMWTDGRLDYYLVGENADALNRLPALLDPDHAPAPPDTPDAALAPPADRYARIHY